MFSVSLKVFISSSCSEEKYKTVRKQLKDKIEQTQLADVESGDLYEWIGDHTKKILQEQESTLKKMPGTGDKYTIELR